MNKFMKVLAASALVATALTGCGSKAKYAKVGFGMVITPGDQTSTTMATVGLDGDGKIQYVDLDVIQAPNGKDETKTKDELKEAYDMKKASGIGKEWYEQATYLESQLVGKTADEVASIETEKKDEHHTAVPKAGSDIATGCTMDIGAFKEAVAKAVANAQEVEAEKIGTGEVVTWDGTQKNTTTAVVALDADDKVVWSTLDVSQNPNGKDETKSKKELKEAYDMKKASGIGKEWYEQATYLESQLIGKTASDVAAIETEKKDEHHTAVPKAGSDIATGCTMDIGDFKAALAEAFELAK